MKYVLRIHNLIGLSMDLFVDQTETRSGRFPFQAGEMEIGDGSWLGLHIDESAETIVVDLIAHFSREEQEGERRGVESESFAGCIEFLSCAVAGSQCCCEEAT